MLQPGTIYRHYKSRGWNNHTYEIVGIAKHSENSEELVIYRPLFHVEEKLWLYGYNFAARPLSMWNEVVEWGWKQVSRFTLITK